MSREKKEAKEESEDVRCWNRTIKRVRGRRERGERKELGPDSIPREEGSKGTSSQELKRETHASCTSCTCRMSDELTLDVHGDLA